MTEQPHTHRDINPYGHFGFIGEASTVKGFTNGTNRIYFAPIDGRTLPPELLDVQNQYEATEAVLLVAFENEPRILQQFFQDLLRGAQLMQGADPNIPLSQQALRSLKDSVLRRAGPLVKKKYLRELGAYVAGASLALTGAGIALVHFQLTPQWSHLPNYLFALASAAAAMWLSFAGRKQRLTFEELADPEGDMMSAPYRVLYVAGFTIVILFLCAARVANVSVGDFSTETMGSNFVSAVLFGFSCGFSERILATTVAPHVSKIIAGLGQHSAK